MKFMNYLIEPGGFLGGELEVPGDKSISHRALILAAISEGTSKIENFLEGEDSLKTLHALREMGVVIEKPSAAVVGVKGVGLRGLKPPFYPLDMGNSGTAMRLLMGILSAQSFDSVLIGDASLSRRPMDRVAIPLRLMGAEIKTQNGFPPVTITGGRRLEGVSYRLPVASAQVKSALLLAGLYARGVTKITEPQITRDHTERLLRAFSYPVEQAGPQIKIRGMGTLTATNVCIPGDFSSAAFFIVGGLIAKNSELLIKKVGTNPTRLGALSILKAMGGDIRLKNERYDNIEPVADIVVKSSSLKGIEIPASFIPQAIDELPVLMIAAACAHGKTILRGAKELKFKESDRIKAVVEGLTRLGIVAKETEDGMSVRGGNLGGGLIESHGDHRIVMAFAMAALRSRFEIKIEGCENVRTSFPFFVETAQRVGLPITNA